jgi:hypothetical protein
MRNKKLCTSWSETSKIAWQNYTLCVVIFKYQKQRVSENEALDESTHKNIILIKDNTLHVRNKAAGTMVLKK